MSQKPWKVAGLVLVAALITLQAAAFFYSSRLRREATGSYADAERSLRESKYRDEAIVLFRSEHRDGEVRFTPVTCLRVPKDASVYAWQTVSLDPHRGAPHCQGAIAFADSNNRPVSIAYIYDGVVGLPTDFGVGVTLADYLAAVRAASE